MFDIPFKVDLARGVQKTIIRQVLATEDNLAHTFHIACTRNDAAEDLTGATVSGYFIRADGVTASLTGSAKGNVVSVTLDQTCYKVEGRCNLIVKLTKDGAVSTIFWGEGNVSPSQTDTIIDDGEITLSLEEMLAKVAEAEARVATAENQATASAEAAASAEASATASAEAAVAAGNSATTLKTACENATAAANEAADRANQAADSSAWVPRMEALEAQATAMATALAAVQAATTPTVLWAAAEDADNWSSGSITVEGISEWYLVDIQTALGHAIGINTGSSINAGFVSRYGATDSQQTVSVAISVENDTLTFGAATRIRHKPDDTHGTIANTTIKAIIGLMKKGIVATQE